MSEASCRQCRKVGGRHPKEISSSRAFSERIPRKTKASCGGAPRRVREGRGSAPVAGRWAMAGVWAARYAQLCGVHRRRRARQDIASPLAKPSGTSASRCFLCDTTTVAVLDETFSASPSKFSRPQCRASSGWPRACAFLFSSEVVHHGALAAKEPFFLRLLHPGQRERNEEGWPLVPRQSTGQRAFGIWPGRTHLQPQSLMCDVIVASLTCELV